VWLTAGTPRAVSRLQRKAIIRSGDKPMRTNSTMVTLAALASVLLLSGASAGEGSGNPTFCREPLKKLDMDQTGYIQLYELHGVTKAQFDAVDTNGDGKITLMEYLNCAYKSKPGGGT
jgi:hypothetical protein